MPLAACANKVDVSKKVRANNVRRARTMYVCISDVNGLIL